MAFLHRLILLNRTHFYGSFLSKELTPLNLDDTILHIRKMNKSGVSPPLTYKWLSLTYILEYYFTLIKLIQVRFLKCQEGSLCQNKRRGLYLICPLGLACFIFLKKVVVYMIFSRKKI